MKSLDNLHLAKNIKCKICTFLFDKSAKSIGEKNINIYQNE